MKNRGIILCLLAGFLLYGCAAYEKKAQSGAAVEVNGHYLYRSTLDSMTVGMAAEDSIRVAQQYISQWAKEILLYDEARKGLSVTGYGLRDEIESLVEDYRRALYVHAYEERIVDRRMPKGVPDSTIAQVYERMSDRFMLSESIVKGMLVVVPNDARDIAKLRGWMEKRSLDEIEKYAYKSASGYELFTDGWKTTTELLAQIPLERGELENQLKSKNQIEVSDSLKRYVLQVTEKRLRGEKMPMEYARPEIEKIVLNARQVEFLNKERERLYNEAIQAKKVNFFE